MAPPVAPQLTALVERVVGAPLPVRIRAWDGSESGPADGPVAIIRHRRALRRLLWNPGELGLARAFVAGELDVEGDIADGLSRFWKLARAQDLAGVTLTTADKLDAARLGLRLGILGPRPKPPSSEARLSGGLHTRRRDRAAISHHYDLSNEFYEFLLDPQMAYSCGYWTRDAGPGYGLRGRAARQAGPDLPQARPAAGDAPARRRMRLGVAARPRRDALRRHGGRGDALRASSARSASHGSRRSGSATGSRSGIRTTGRSPDQPFDAVASIEMGEHVGQDNYPVYAAQLHRLLLPHGRLLLQQMSRGAAGNNTAPGGGAFMESYVAPDMYMRPLGSTLNFLEEAGFEAVDVHSLREHYVWTVRPWLDTLQDRKAEAIRLVGEEQYRVWLLYLAGAALAFEENRMGVHQILLVRPDADGRSGLPRSRRDTLGADPAEQGARGETLRPRVNGSPREPVPGPTR